MSDAPGFQSDKWVRARVVVEGRVQGVLFRHHTREQARLFLVGGFVQNQWDGTVLVEAEGEARQVQMLIAWLRRGPSRAYVSGVSIAWIPPVSSQGKAEVTPTFEVRY